MLEKSNNEYEKTVLVGLITKDQDADKSKEYLEKYEMIIVEKELDTTSGYGAHCKNIMDSCTKAIQILQAS